LKAIEVVGDDENIDSLIVIFTPPLVTRSEDVAASIIKAARPIVKTKPLMAVFLSGDAAPTELQTTDLRIPCFSFPETAAIALARAARYREWRERPETIPPRFEDIRSDEAAVLIAAALTRGEGWLTPNEVARLCSCYGLPLVEQRFVSTAEEAGMAAEQLGCAVVLKAVAPGLIHKTEAGAVKLDLKGREEVLAVARQMSEKLTSLGHSPSGFVVQRLAPRGVEMLLGVVHDPQFGPVVACGAGGVQVELLRDVSIRLTPLSSEDAGEMIRELKTYPLLTGFRGGVVCEVRALEDALLRLSAMVEDIPQIAELDFNPFVLHEIGALILDARIRVTTVDPRPLPGVRK